MRTIVFMLLTIGVAAGGFALYLHFQGPVLRNGTGPVFVPPQAIDHDADTTGSMGPGDRPWVKVLDKLGRLSYRFRAGEIEPEQGSRIHVKRPEIEFFQYINESKDPADPRTRTQRIYMVGKTGAIEVQKGPQASSGGFEKGMNGPPKRGILNDVTMRVYPDVRDTRRVSVTLVSPNLAFDNETYEITTHEYTRPDGLIVPADEVPIIAFGDYDFKGRGLTVRWNDLDGRLELLEIAHGEYLVVRNTDLLNKSKVNTTGTPGPATRPSSPLVSLGDDGAAPLVDAQGVPIRLAAKDKGAAARAAAAAKTQPTKPKKGVQPPYQAGFDRDVRISQGNADLVMLWLGKAYAAWLGVPEEQLATADLMNIEFMPGSAAKPTTQPSTQPATQPVAAAPATKPTEVAAGPVTRPATRPAAPPPEPVIVRWNGKLRVIPMEGPGGSLLPSGLTPGESVLKLIAINTPVVLTRQQDRIECTGADYYSSDGSVQLRGSEKFGQVIARQLPDPAAQSGAQAATITTDSINYSGTERVATLHGPSHANILLAQDHATKAASTQPAPEMDAKWVREGRIYFRPGHGNSDLVLDHAVLEGDVDVKHPQLALKSQGLALLFEPKAAPATQPATPASNATVLKQMIATTDVWCDLADTAGKKQTVTTDELSVYTATDADGKLYPKRVVATGSAHAFDATQDLRAGNVDITLAPAPKPATRPTTQQAVLPATVPTTTRPTSQPALGQIDTAAVELQSMRAWDRVAVKNAEGSTATGDRMEVDVINGQTIAKLVGAPLATVTDPKGNIVSGPVIDMEPKRNWAKVSGKGSIHAMQAEPPTTRPTTIPTSNPAALPVSRPATPPKFVDIDWDKQAELDGDKNVILLQGPILVRSTDADGTKNVAMGQWAQIDLTDKPAPATQPTTAQPTTQPASHAATRPASRPSTKPTSAAAMAGGGMDVFKDKVVSAINLEEKVVVNSTLSDTTGILRQMELKSERLRYETGSTAATGAAGATPLAMGPTGTGRIIVPVPGTLLYRDHRQPAHPTTNPAATQPAAGPEGARGATAFWWKKSMVVDQPSKTATLDGDVVIVNRSDEPNAIPVQINTDRAVALFESKQPTTKPTTKPAGPVAQRDPNESVQLKWLTLSGNMIASRAGAVLSADRADYDPATGWMKAVGSGRNSAAYSDATGTSTIWADEIFWNTQTWMTRFVNIRGRSGTDTHAPPKK